MMARSRDKTEAAPRSPRQLRVGEEIRHALAAVIGRGELRDPALRGVAITVSEVRVSADLRHATAFVLPLGGGAADAVVKALGRAAPFLRGEVARAINLRYAPQIVFAPDTAGPAEIVGAHPPLLFDGSAQAIERIDAVLGNPDAQNRARSHLATRAQLFTTERFVAEIRALVAGALGRRGA